MPPRPFPPQGIMPGFNFRYIVHPSLHEGHDADAEEDAEAILRAALTHHVGTRTVYGPTSLTDTRHPGHQLLVLFKETDSIHRVYAVYGLEEEDSATPRAVCIAVVVIRDEPQRDSKTEGYTTVFGPTYTQRWKTS